MDDLAQPPSYSSKNHLAVIDNLILRILKNEIIANLPTLLTQFPESFQKIIDISRTTGIEQRPDEIKNTIDLLIKEI